jgi:hypothetical protein
MGDKAMMKIGVLFTDSIHGERYHILKANSNHHFSNGEIIRDALTHDRKASGEMYQLLYNRMQYFNLDALWVQPDCQFSLWLDRKDFDLIEGMGWFSPHVSGRNGKPTGLRIKDKYIFWPAHMRMTKEVRSEGQWLIPSPDILYDSVDYVQSAMTCPLLWSAGYTSMSLLRKLTSQDIDPFTGHELWGEAQKHMVCRPDWSHRLRNGEKGLTDEHKRKKYVYGFDKDNQYLKACQGLELGNGDPIEVYPPEDLQPFMFKDQIAFWEYEITDVSKSPFNSYELYCPLSRRYNWASSSLLAACQQVGIEFKIKRGLVWKRSAGRVLTPWANQMKDGIISLQDERLYPHTLAAHNARGTMKLGYVEMIGRFCAEYSKEFYHRDWNMFVTHEAIEQQLQTIWKRKRDENKSPVLVSADSLYILSDSENPEGGYPGILSCGFKLVGKCELTPDIIDMFASEKFPSKIEDYIKKEMTRHEHVTIR